MKTHQNDLKSRLFLKDLYFFVNVWKDCPLSTKNVSAIETLLTSFLTVGIHLF